jgi:hypothetical protein
MDFKKALLTGSLFCIIAFAIHYFFDQKKYTLQQNIVISTAGGVVIALTQLGIDYFRSRKQ